jgi:hypothetical protein
MSDARLRYIATERNRGPILDVLRDVLPARGLALEIASGSGEHVVHFARHLPGLEFQPSDPEPKARDSVAAWTLAEGLTNIRPPLFLDAAGADWPVAAADAVLCVNMVHISPWRATLGLLAGAAKIMPAGAPLFLYGPYVRAGVETAPSNLAFDADLKRRNPDWGLRDLADVARAAAMAGFGPPEVFDMPANNIGVVFRRL